MNNISMSRPWSFAWMKNQSNFWKTHESQTHENRKAGTTRWRHIRNFSCSIFIFTELLAGWRHLMACERRTKIDWANQIRDLLEIYYPDTPKIRPVIDNLNTHSISSLYEAFNPSVARSLARRLEIHHTPKHGSWLNVAEIELSTMTRQSLDSRIPSLPSLCGELST